MNGTVYWPAATTTDSMAPGQDPELRPPVGLVFLFRTDCTGLAFALVYQK